MTGAEQRPCPACGALFTWTPAGSRQKYCSADCRYRWWNLRRRQATAALRRGGPSAPAPAAHAARGETPRGHGPRDRGPRDAGGIVAAVPACPHCREPVAVVAWLVPPGAASVATPNNTPATMRDI